MEKMITHNSLQLVWLNNAIELREDEENDEGEDADRFPMPKKNDDIWNNIFEDKDGGKTFCWFCDNFIPCLKTVKIYNAKICKEKMDVFKVCTPSDFAFARLKFEDYYDTNLWKKKSGEKQGIPASLTAQNDQEEPSSLKMDGPEDEAKKKAAVGKNSSKKRSKLHTCKKHLAEFKKKVGDNDNEMMKKCNQIYKDHLKKLEAKKKMARKGNEESTTDITEDIDVGANMEDDRGYSWLESKMGCNKNIAAVWR